jgi:hypothetical protein
MDGSEVKTLGRVGEWMVMEGSGVKGNGWLWRVQE